MHLPEDARLRLELPPAALAALPAQWRELARPAGRRMTAIEVPRLRSNAFCGVRLHAGAAFACRFLLQPSKGMAAGLHTVEIRQFDGDVQVGGITWALRPKR